MKITDVSVHVVLPNSDFHRRTNRAWAFVQIDTDAGITGWGEVTNYHANGSHLTGYTIRLMRDLLIGEDPSNIEQLWHKLYHRYSYLGSRGVPTVAISGIDIALWDIKGKALNRPIYDLLGGKVRDTVPLYANGWFVGCKTLDAFAQKAQQTVATGYQALKLDPYRSNWENVSGGQISKEAEQHGSDIVQTVREAVGPNIDLLIDAHGHYNVPTAIRLANRLFDESRIDWFEEPVAPESVDALRQVRAHCRAPISVGERLFTRWDVMPVLQQNLTDYLMPDIIWTGGISELKKIATMAEVYAIPISPHNAMGSLQIIAGAHVALSIPNFYRLEHSVVAIPHYNEMLTEPINFQSGAIHLSDKPGLGFNLDIEYLKKHQHPNWT